MVAPGTFTMPAYMVDVAHQTDTTMAVAVSTNGSDTTMPIASPSEVSTSSVSTTTSGQTSSSPWDGLGQWWNSLTPAQQAGVVVGGIAVIAVAAVACFFLCAEAAPVFAAAAAG